MALTKECRGIGENAYSVRHATHSFLLFLFVEIESRHNRTQNYLKSNAATAVVSCLLSVVKFFFYCIFFFLLSKYLGRPQREKTSLRVGIVSRVVHSFAKEVHTTYISFYIPRHYSKTLKVVILRLEIFPIIILFYGKMFCM